MSRPNSTFRDLPDRRLAASETTSSQMLRDVAAKRGRRTEDGEKRAREQSTFRRDNVSHTHLPDQEIKARSGVPLKPQTPWTPPTPLESGRTRSCSPPPPASGGLGRNNATAKQEKKSSVSEVEKFSLFHPKDECCPSWTYPPPFRGPSPQRRGEGGCIGLVMRRRKTQNRFPRQAERNVRRLWRHPTWWCRQPRSSSPPPEHPQAEGPTAIAPRHAGGRANLPRFPLNFWTARENWGWTPHPKRTLPQRPYKKSY